jgi:hypothetical protein
MAGKIDWARVQRSTVVTELVQLSLALVALAAGWLSFPLLMLTGMVELVLLAALSSLFFRERSALGHLADVIKMLALCGFCAVFLLAVYAGAGGFERGLIIDPRGVAVVVVLVIGRLLVIAMMAWRSTDRRLYWTRGALLRGGTVLVAMLLSVFVCFIPGVPLAGLLRMAWPMVAADVAVGGCFLLVQVVIACIMSTMSDREVAEISQQPYVE